MANEKTMIVPLSNARKHARPNRTQKALTELRRQLFKHYRKKPAQIRLSQGVNEAVWGRGREKPPSKLEIKTVLEDDLLRVYLAGEKIAAPKKEAKKSETKKEATPTKAETEKALEDEKKLEEKREREKIQASLGR